MHTSMLCSGRSLRAAAADSCHARRVVTKAVQSLALLHPAAPSRRMSASAAPCSRTVPEVTAGGSYGTWRSQRGWKPLHVTRAKDMYFWDAAGKRYLDLSSQLMCSNLGHQNQAVVDAIVKQAQELAFISPAFTCDVRAQVVEKLRDVVPPGLADGTSPPPAREYTYATRTHRCANACNITLCYALQFVLVVRQRTGSCPSCPLLSCSAAHFTLSSAALRFRCRQALFCH